MISVTIGKHGKLTAEQAREEARKVLFQLSQGINPHEERRERQKAAEAEKIGQMAEDPKEPFAASRSGPGPEPQELCRSPADTESVSLPHGRAQQAVLKGGDRCCPAAARHLETAPRVVRPSLTA